MMVNNGKYCNGGMIINPFATINDGLLDVTWIDAPEYQGTLSVSGIMSRARSGGIQAYEGHSQYVRGRKLRIDIPEPEQVQPELELEENEETAKPDRQEQVIMVDGEALNYKTSIIWECFPSNIEVMIDD